MPETEYSFDKLHAGKLSGLTGSGAPNGASCTKARYSFLLFLFLIFFLFCFFFAFSKIEQIRNSENLIF
jgi:hypothetical protein